MPEWPSLLVRGLALLPLLSLAALSGCIDSEQPPPLVTSPRDAVLAIDEDYSVTSGVCTPVEPVCLVGAYSTIIATILPNVTLHSAAFTATTPATGYEVDWEVFCYEAACPAEPLANGHGAMPIAVSVDSIDLAGVNLRFRLEATNSIDEKPEVAQFDPVDLVGVANITWGPPMVEVVREERLVLRTTPCLAGLDCNPLTAQPAIIELQGVAIRFELQAEWTAIAPSDQRLSFGIFCAEDPCREEFDSEYVSSPASFEGYLDLMGETVWVQAAPNMAGVVGHTFGAGTEVHVQLRLTELVPSG